jgi:hypothetical protein
VRIAGTLVAVAMLCGCGACEHREHVKTSPTQHRTCAHLPVAVSAPRLASGLIFDRQPGPFSASDFAWRSDWPSTDSYYRQEEITFYREEFHDIQGPGLHNNDQTYRRFDTYRYGQAVR